MSIDITKKGTYKPKNSRLHTITRAKERFNIELTMSDIERIELRIRTQTDAFFLARESKTRSVWMIRVEGKIMVAIYNNKQKCLSTVLPSHNVKKYLNQ